MSIRNEIPGRHDLFKYIGEVIIEKEGIDHNNHLNNARYFSICEQQRNLFMKACGIDNEALRKNSGLRMFAKSGSFDFKQQVFEGNRINIHTSAEVVSAHLEFNQRMTREGLEVFNLQCVVLVVDANGKPTRLPDVITKGINQANLTKQTKQ